MAGGASIADLFFRAFMEDKDLQLQAQKAGDKAGQTMGGRMSKGIGTALRVGLGVVAGAAAIATKGLVELDDTMAQFTADTGLAGKEADKAKKSILAMSGRNLQPMKEIGATLGKVHTDLGLVGEQADKTAEDFLHFARVTGRDAAEEVKSFDDILDAWGLTADHSGEIMDKLIASHQKYGGSIEANEAALSAMAPQLKALNLDIDDGIGLLNLFASSGLDAAAIPKALNAAIKNLDGKPLGAFVAELASIEDDGERARRAMEIFGTKAGAGLANAIKPGMTSLQDFQVTTEDATGALDKARDAIDGTFSNQVKLKIKAVTARITEFGSAFGPALTGLASLASLGGALGLDKLIVGAFGKVKNSTVVKTAAAAAGSAIGAVYGAAVASAEKLVKLAKDALGILAKRGIVKAAAERAGLIIGAVFGAAAVAGDKITQALVLMFNKLPFAGAVRGAVLASALKIGTLSGTQMGSAAGLAFKAAFVVGIAALADEVAPKVEEAGRDIGEQIPFLLKERQALGNALQDFNRDMPWPLGMKGAPDWAGGGPSPVADLGPNMANDMREAKGGVTAAATAMVSGIPDAQEDAQDKAVQIAKATPHAIARALLDNQFSVEDAMAEIAQVQADALTENQEATEIAAFLSSKALAKGLQDGRPAVRAIWQAYKDDAESRLFALQNDVPDIALNTGIDYADALGVAKTNVRTSAQALVTAARLPLEGIDTYDWGKDGGKDFAQGLRDQAQKVALAAGYLAKVAAQHLEFGSPTEKGPFSKKGGPYGWAKIGATDWVKGWLGVDPGAIRGWAQSASRALAVPGGQFAMAGAGALGGGTVPSMGAGFAGDTITSGDTHVNVQLPGLLRAETPTDVVRTLRHLNVYGTFRK